jgi:hypothetical protein
MYYCWKYHHIRPKEYYDMMAGEKTVLQAFYFKEMEELKEKNEAIAESGMCPAMFAH